MCNQHLAQRNFLILGALLVLITSCARATPPPASPTPEVVRAAPPTTPTKADTTAYYPTQAWKTSTPEQQGIDSAALLKLFDEIQQKQFNIHSIVIARHGFIVAEAYWYPFQPGYKHVLYSCTKSVNSALVGVAIKQGKIDNVNHRVVDFFPDRTIANKDARKQAMTLEHLLTMSSGMEWNETGVSITAPNNSNRQMIQSKDWVQFVLDRPMKEEPGARFNYNSGGAHLISAILQKTTGQNELAFAQEYLFKPLGISDVTWAVDPNGIYRGEDGLELTPRDMAKIGYLFLKNGTWDGQQIVSADWVKASSQKHIDTPDDKDYGYQWWVQPFGIYNAAGRGSQYIFVLNDLDMVVVFTSGLKTKDFDLPASLVEKFVIPSTPLRAGPAAKPQPLPENTTATAALAARIKAIGQAEPKPVPALPAIAQTISGKTYTLENNSLNLRGFALTFQDKDVLFRMIVGDKRVDTAVGLDNVFRVTRIEARGEVAMRGSWQNDKTFVIQQQFLNEADRLEYAFTFDKDAVDLRLTGFIEGNAEQARGKVQN
jgi:CubicO group peptidase (beta-lactamase class C family)